MTHCDLTWPETQSPDLGALVATLKDGTLEWRDNLGLPSPEAIIWSPYPNGPSIGGLLLHLASTELFWIQKVANGVEISPEHPAEKYDSTMDQYLPHWPIPPNEPIQWYFKIQDDTRTEMIDLILAHNDPSRGYENRRGSFTYRWILAHIVEHDSYHGGQAVLLHEMFKKLHP